jgi:hypothetical protein
MRFSQVQSRAEAHYYPLEPRLALLGGNEHRAAVLANWPHAGPHSTDGAPQPLV